MLFDLQGANALKFARRCLLSIFPGVNALKCALRYELFDLLGIYDMLIFARRQISRMHYSL